MGDSLMKEEELEAIGGYVKTHIAQWLKESKIIPIEAAYQSRDYERDVSLAERIVRVEEGIKHQGEILEKILHQMDKRFEQVDKRFGQIDKRFEQIDKRLDLMEKSIDSRFEQVDKRIEELREDMNSRFSHLQWTMGIGFTTMAALMGIFNFF